jgi:hypothetical protein
MNHTAGWMLDASCSLLDAGGSGSNCGGKQQNAAVNRHCGR